ncbi:unnamed protein product [Meloidogyne enterolobii]|uniref:Uncharacterized protein n=1 Tax=Meloidogyne enterolobii TaxID=390850 RepID=A0ACB0XSX9_MELEN
MQSGNSFRAAILLCLEIISGYFEQSCSNLIGPALSIFTEMSGGFLDDNKIHECFCKYCGERKKIEVNSIQCIKCNFWVHGECAGYKKGDIRKMKESKFKCKYCVKEEEEEEKKKLALIGI